MAPSKYRTSPLPMETMPPGIPYIIGNEAAERFSFYGMRAILVIFMTQYLMGSNGQLDLMNEDQAKEWFHTFVSANYFCPILGALLSDIFFGKYRTIILLSIVYCLGHLALAMNDTRTGLLIGLGLIALGSGGIKPCVSAHVGDQFGKSNEHLLSKIFSWFYFSINVGACLSMLMIPIVLDKRGPHVAFAIPGVLMLIATFAFWLGRNKFVHIPASGSGFIKEVFTGEGIKTIRNLSVIYLIFMAMFFALFDQSSSAWVLQAKKMDLDIFGIPLLPSQIQAVNPFLILVFIPLFHYKVYPAIDRVFPLTPLRKMSIGFFVTVAAFAVPAFIEMRIGAIEAMSNAEGVAYMADKAPSIGWHVLAYVLLTSAEIMVSITGLEFAYTQAPKKMKSFIMSFYLLAMSLGNAFTALVNIFIQNDDGTSKLEGASYYWFFTALMLVSSVGFIFVAMAYRERHYIQGEEPA